MVVFANIIEFWSDEYCTLFGRECIVDTERRAIETLAPKYAARREVLKAIPKFWAVALMNNELFAMQAQHHGDQAALAYLEDVWLVRDPVETRVFTIEFVSGVY